MRYCFLRYPQGKAKAVTFSYDDGIRPDIHLAEICDRYGIKCTFNLNSVFIAPEDGQWHLSANEIKQYLLASGHEIAVHGHLHRAPGAVRPIEMIQDVLQCRLELEKTFGGIIRGMAYPDYGITFFCNGANYENVRRNLRDLDIAYARTLGGDNDTFALPADWYAWMPTAHHNNPHVLDYARAFVAMDTEKQESENRRPRLFYLWGHSFEFENAKNWDHLENICRILGGKDDIWYATNMEICSYVHAYESLIFSADNRVVYNPSLVRIWFDIDGKLYTIEPGQTRTLEI